MRVIKRDQIFQKGLKPKLSVLSSGMWTTSRLVISLDTDVLQAFGMLQLWNRQGHLLVCPLLLDYFHMVNLCHGVTVYTRMLWLGLKIGDS